MAVGNFVEGAEKSPAGRRRHYFVIWKGTILYQRFFRCAACQMVWMVTFLSCTRYNST